MPSNERTPLQQYANAVLHGETNDDLDIWQISQLISPAAKELLALLPKKLQKQVLRHLQKPKKSK